MIALDTVTVHTNTAYLLCAQAVSEHHHSVRGRGGKGEGRRRIDNDDNVEEVKQERGLEEHREPGSTRLCILVQNQN